MSVVGMVCENDRDLLFSSLCRSWSSNWFLLIFSRLVVWSRGKDGRDFLW